MEYRRLERDQFRGVRWTSMWARLEELTFGIAGGTPLGDATAFAQIDWLPGWENATLPRAEPLT